MTRSEIEAKIKSNLETIALLSAHNDALRIESYLLTDGEQQFEEKVESHPRAKWARKDHPLDGKLVGRISWEEDFVDEDTGNVISISRHRVVRVDGEWVV